MPDLFQGLALLLQKCHVSLTVGRPSDQLVYLHKAVLQKEEVIGTVGKNARGPHRQPQQLIPLLQHPKRTELHLVLRLDSLKLPHVLYTFLLEPLLAVTQLPLLMFKCLPFRDAEFPLLPDLLIQILLGHLGPPLKLLPGLFDCLPDVRDLLILLRDVASHCLQSLGLCAPLPLDCGVTITGTAHQAPAEATDTATITPEPLALLTPLHQRCLTQRTCQGATNGDGF
eukprot:CAMPEP_0180832656 /NCGR_PEP_ID=MMETSP1038_2-20121128/76950_1 /TAXON_ID=632150 /ORGANISM="Azadinium spinosum, Strain 3D9" /LENGTH=226 /DNA_ID=CAMNT_0022875859 /DNA_START=301 /DNA_END=981 /DNA_ORIENTATION=+